jgi:cystathionine beta-lyase/cystathionine gamma-synthase
VDRDGLEIIEARRNIESNLKEEHLDKWTVPLTQSGLSLMQTIEMQLAAPGIDVLAQSSLRVSTTVTLLTTIMQSFYVHSDDNKDMWARCVC